MTLQIVPADSGRTLKQFINLPWTIYRDDPYWVPPLKSEVRELLSLKHPFYQHAQRKLFLALDSGMPVGRVAAIINNRHNEFHSEKSGFFGFFECVDDLEVADSLFLVAATKRPEAKNHRLVSCASCVPLHCTDPSCPPFF